MRTLLPLGVMLLAGCGPALPDQLVEGRRVRYHYWADMGAPCPEAIERIDRVIEQIAAKVNRPLPGDFRVEYFRVRDLEAVRDSCVPRANGCAIGNKVYTAEWSYEHEITHAVLNQFGLPPYVFMEGIAVVFGCGPARWVGEPIEKVDIAPLFDNAAWSRALDGKNYVAAGSFTKWLVDRHGLEVLIAFYEAAAFDSTRKELDVQFRAAFGVELNDAVSEWSALPASLDGQYCIPFEDACDGAPDLAPPGNFTTPVTCVDRVAVLEVGTSPMTQVRFTASEDGRRLKLRPCDASGSPGRDFFLTFVFEGPKSARWIDWWAPLKPGRYSLTIERSPAGPGSFRDNAPPGGTASIVVSSHGAVVNDTCSAEPIMISDDTFASMINVGSDGGVIRLEPQSDRRIAGLYGHVDGQLTLCTACTSVCRSIDTGTSYPDWLRGPTSVRVPGLSDGGVAWVEFSLEPPL